MSYRSLGVVSRIFLLFTLIPSQFVSAQEAMATARNDFVPSTARQITLGAAPAGTKAEAITLSDQGSTLVELGLYKESVAYFEKAAKAMPGSPTAWLNLSLIYDHVDRVADSLAAAKQALDLDASSRVARMQVCDMSVHSHLYREAFACYLELEKTGRLDDRLLANFGIAAMGMGEVAKAQAILEPISARQPYNAELQNALGVLFFKRKNLPQALAYFKRAIETDPDRGLYRYNMALAQMKNRNRAAVLSQYRLLQTSDPKTAAKLARYIFRDKLVFVGEDQGWR